MSSNTNVNTNANGNANTMVNTNTMVNKAAITDNNLVDKTMTVADESGNKSIDKSNDKSAMTTIATTGITTTITTNSPTTPPVILTHPLSPWNQIAPRVYTPRALCFPFSRSANLNPSQAHSLLLSTLSSRLQHLVTLRPSLGGKLQLGINLSDVDRDELKKQGKYNPWHVYLQTSEADRIEIKAQYPEAFLAKHKWGRETKSLFGGQNQEVEMESVKGWPEGYLDYEWLKMDEFPVEPFVNPLLTDLRTLKEGGEALPAVMVKVLFLRGGFVLNVLGHHSLFDGGAFTQFLNGFAEMMRMPMGPLDLEMGWMPQPLEKLPMGHDLSLSLPMVEDKKYEELLALCPEYKEWEGKAKNGPTHPVCDALPGREGEVSTGSSRIFVFTFAKIAQLSSDIKQKHGVKAGIYECLSGLLWSLTYHARFKVAHDSPADPNADFERFLHDHFSTAQPVFSTPTDWIARVASSNSSPEFKAQIATETANYLGNKITWISTRTVSSSLLLASGQDLSLSSSMSLANLSQVISAIAQSSTDVGKNMEEFLTVRHSLFHTLSSSAENDIRQIGLSFDPRQPSEWQMNSWKNFGADTEWVFPSIPRDDGSGLSEPIVPLNACRGAQDGVVNVTKPDAVRRVQARYGVSGGLWLPARKEDKKEVLVQISLPEEVMKTFVEVVKGWVERVI